MTTTADQTGRLGRRAATGPPRRAVVPASFGQALVWLAVVALVVGPFLPLLYASVRSKPSETGRNAWRSVTRRSARKPETESRTPCTGSSRGVQWRTKRWARGR